MSSSPPARTTSSGLGLAWLILTGAWPPGAIILAATNDLVWWIPFAGYLRDAWPAFRHGIPGQPLQRH